MPANEVYYLMNNLEPLTRVTNYRLQISVMLLLLLATTAGAQNNYVLRLKGADRDSATLAAQFNIPPAFANRFACVDFINKLRGTIQGQGYVTSSFDSLRYDTTFASLVLFLGEKFRWASLDAGRVDRLLLDAIGWRDNIFTNQPMDFSQVAGWEEKILDYLENNGHPFARVYLDSLRMDQEKVWAQLKVDKGPVYHIDSIRVYGNAKITNTYLQRYLDIPNGSIYNKSKLFIVSRKLRELVYLEEEQPATLTRLGSGSVLNLYLRQKKSSQINVLIGILPNNDQLSSKKVLVTGEANINLKNAFGAGETIGLNWQQLQVKSPRLDIVFQYPYIFHSPVGLDFAFGIFRKDSTFVNINLQIGAQYILNTNQAGKIFLQRSQTIVNGVNTTYVLQNRRLTDEADLSSVNVGVDYEYNNTNYRLNPRKGNDFRIVASAGTKQIKKNNQVVELKDPGDPTFDFGTLYDTVKLKTYQFRARGTFAKYLPVGKQSTIKTAINAGIFQSGSVFRNELFQIGGYKLLRGFDEESQYLSQFAIGTVEYRILAGQANSYFYVLADGGWGRNNSQNINVSYTYFGTGIGLAFENKAGVFNLAWAVGARNDTKFNLRQSKIHFGFVNYF
jgi:outer membrane protein assembly factor BamA